MLDIVVSALILKYLFYSCEIVIISASVLQIGKMKQRGVNKLSKAMQVQEIRDQNQAYLVLQLVCSR